MHKIITLLLLIVATAFASCKKDSDNPGSGANYNLLGTWEDTSPSTATYNWTGQRPADRYTFKTEEAYFKFYLGDIGEEGKFEVVLTDAPSVIRVRLVREGTTPSDTLTIEWVNNDLIRISDNTAMKRNFKRI